MSATGSIPTATAASSHRQQRTTRAGSNIGTIGRMDITKFLSIVQQIRDAFPTKPDERWIHRYREQITAHDPAEKPANNTRRQIFVDRVVEAPTWEGLRAWFAGRQDVDVIHHLELHLTDGPRKVRLELGSPRGIEHRSSHRVRVETTEPDDELDLARIGTLFDEIHNQALNRLTRAFVGWMWLVAIPVAVLSQYIDSTVKHGYQGQELINRISAGALFGGIACLIALIYALIRIRRKAASCLAPDWSATKSRVGFNKQLRQMLRSFWQILHLQNAAINTLVAILALILGALSLFLSIK